METVIISAITAILGFISGLFTPWVKWWIAKRQLQHEYRKQMVRRWRIAVKAEAHDFIDARSSFLSTEVYSTLRLHIDPKIRNEIEQQRTFYVGGARGDAVRKNMLLDEIARLEKKWKLI